MRFTGSRICHGRILKERRVLKNMAQDSARECSRTTLSRVAIIDENESVPLVAVPAWLQKSARGITYVVGACRSLQF